VHGFDSGIKFTTLFRVSADIEDTATGKATKLLALRSTRSSRCADLHTARVNTHRGELAPTVLVADVEVKFGPNANLKD
jgi:hypothetical protein